MMKWLLGTFGALLITSNALAASCGSYPFTLQNNTTADATQVMADFNTVRNCVINNAAGSGVNTDITSITGLSTPLSVPQGGTPVFIGGTSTGSANAQVVASTTPIGYALTSGYRITFTPGFTNTGAAQLNVNSTGLTDVRKLGHDGLEALTGGEMVAGNIVEALYNGTYFVLLTNSFSDFNTLTTIASATTTDLGTISSHNAQITGTTTITGFGSTASITEPIYLISFTGSLTLTYNATSLIIPGAANITTANGDTAMVEYLGTGNWRVLQYTRVSGAGIVSVTPLCGATGWTMTNNAGTPNTNVDIVAANYVLLNSSNNVTFTGSSLTATINFATNGAVNTLDTGTLTAGPKWYYVYIISNGTTTGGLGSLSATSPTMPSGYVYKCLLGAMPTTAANIFQRLYQSGNVVTYQPVLGTNTVTYPVIDQGIKGTYSGTSPTIVSASVLGNGFCAPSIATDIQINVVNDYKGNAASDVIIHNDNFGGAVLTNMGPVGSAGQVWSVFLSSGVGIGTSTWLKALSSSVYWAADTAGGAMACRAFKLPVNAN